MSFLKKIEVIAEIAMEDIISKKLDALSDLGIEEILLSTRKSMKEYLRNNPDKIKIVLNKLYSLSHLLLDLSSRVESRRNDLIKVLSEQIKEQDIKVKPPLRK